MDLAANGQSSLLGSFLAWMIEFRFSKASEAGELSSAMPVISGRQTC